MGQPSRRAAHSSHRSRICERTASTAVLDGSIAPLGSQYVLGLRAKDCQTREGAAEEQAQAARKEDVLNALDQMAGQFRKQVGESLTTVEKYDTPLAEATTPSLEALKAYSLGLQKDAAAGAQSRLLPFYGGRWSSIRTSPTPTGPCRGRMPSSESRSWRPRISARLTNCETG